MFRTFKKDISNKNFKIKIILKYLENKNWYALRVKSQSQRLAHLGLNKKSFEVLNPLFNKLSFRKDRKKFLTKPIFNGYMFIRALLNPECHLEILKTPGVVEILKSAIGPSPVPDTSQICLWSFFRLSIRVTPTTN